MERRSKCFSSSRPGPSLRPVTGVSFCAAALTSERRLRCVATAHLTEGQQRHAWVCAVRLFDRQRHTPTEHATLRLNARPETYTRHRCSTCYLLLLLLSLASCSAARPRASRKSATCMIGSLARERMAELMAACTASSTFHLARYSSTCFSESRSPVGIVADELGAQRAVPKRAGQTLVQNWPPFAWRRGGGGAPTPGNTRASTGAQGC